MWGSKVNICTFVPHIQKRAVRLFTFYDLLIFIHVKKQITFQCVLATDGVRSFTMFHYEDEMDLSVRNFVRGYLQMGYDAGDGIHYYQHPQSFSRGLFNVFNTSNVGIPGVWIFRLDTEDTAIVQCSTQSFGMTL